MLARLSRLAGGTLGRVAADLRLQFNDVEEHVRLPAQFVGDHRWLSRDGRDHGDAYAAALHGFDQRTEIAVAGEQHHVIDVAGDLHRIDRELDVHVALDLAAAGLVDELFRGLGDDGIAVVVEPIDQRTNRRILLILHNGGVIEGAQQISAGLEFTQQTLVVDIEAERLRRRVEICAVDEQRDLLTGYGHFSLLIGWGAAQKEWCRLPTSLTVW